ALDARRGAVELLRGGIVQQEVIDCLSAGVGNASRRIVSTEAGGNKVAIIAVGVGREVERGQQGIGGAWHLARALVDAGGEIDIAAGRGRDGSNDGQAEWCRRDGAAREGDLG